MRRFDKYSLLLMLLLPASMLKAQQGDRALSQKIKPTVFHLSMVMMHDVVNPPAAARYYAYCLLGAYDIVSHCDQRLVSPEKFCRDYKGAEISVPKDQYDLRLASLYCILETGRQMMPSGFTLEEQEKELDTWLQQQAYSKEIIEQSIKVAGEVTAHVLKYAAGDGYGKLSSMMHYTPIKGDAYWYPTPPAYMEAIEPNWKTIRPLVIDSCNQFVPPPPVAFSNDSGSAFYNQAYEVYKAVKYPDDYKLTIAAFWDCNPFVVATSGHMMLGFKKISPGGHWMNIAGIASENAGLDFNQNVMVQFLTGVTIMDAFISCWDEKYRSNRVRPESYINRRIDPQWTPILQTPPFPEYTSGHSVVSTAAAVVLAFLFGNRQEFLDDTEILFELEPRKYHSFMEAANEAAISRLYGGIHYRDAIENGQVQGRAIGNFIAQQLSADSVRLYK